MAWTIGELSKFTGLTLRALRHYDEIGLVKPSSRTAANHRLYDSQDVLRLQQVVLYREMGLSLDDIARTLEDAVHRRDVLTRQRALLLERRARCDDMIAALDRALHDIQEGREMSQTDIKALFDGFDPKDYEAEVEHRWGDSEAYRESKRRTRTYRKGDWERIKAESADIYQRIAQQMKAGVPPEDALVQAEVEAHRLHIDRWFYPCSHDMHRNLAQMYVADPRFTENLDKVAPGFATYLSEAITLSTS